MKYEKSCGAVLWRNNHKREYLLILNKKGNSIGHWGFPKGHTEGNETEFETAKREIFEETGIVAKSFAEGFRVVTHYSPAPNIEKDVVYFLCEVKDSNIVLQESEVAEFKWLDFESAKELLTFDIDILTKAESFLG